ncbi:MAG: hypothetical protein NTY06_01910, partial [Candidatus Gottesmanbacteria bacterium]|nr:hypothetical protein [Candidatus Gottesmanbacteria bacterium]
EPTDHARFAVDFLLEQLKITKHPPMTITINSDIPAGYHLGSSAAVAVALSGAVVYFFKKLWNPMKINELAYEIEKKQHGNPSGGDNTTVTVGGFVWFRKELEFLKSIWQLPLKLSSALNHFHLIDTGRPKENTGEMVAYVHTNYLIHTAQYKKLFDINEEQTKRITVAIKEGDEKTLIDAIRKGQRSLEGMGVVSKKVTPLIRKIEKSGGAAKILGGGGRVDGVGYLLCYTHNPPKGSISITLGEEGIRLESKS